MFTVSPTTKRMNDMCRTISNDIFDIIQEEINIEENEREKLKNVYNEAVSLTLNNNKSNNTKDTFKKPRIPIPFYGFILQDRCFGVKKNHNLYTQCMNSKIDGRYCKVCAKQANNSSTGKPVYGDIRDRKQQWNEQLVWAPEGKIKEVPYMNIVKKMGLQVDQAQQIVKELGWDPIPNCHLEERKIRRGRPKVKNVAGEDSDDEDKPKRKRGRPVGSFKKKEKKKEPTDEELIALLCGE